MKYLNLIILLLLISCGNSKKNFVCGDHPCLDKKEVNEYFKKTLILEVQLKEIKKNLSVDLVKLNTVASNKDATNKPPETSVVLSKKKQKTLLKAQKKFLKEERRIKKIEEKNTAIKAKEIAKLRKRNNKIKKLSIDKNLTNKELTSIDKSKEQNGKISEKKEKEIINFKSTKSRNQSSLCSKIKDCDINKISELLIKKGKEKDYPSITSK
jgi:hypothetical protein